MIRTDLYFDVFIRRMLPAFIDGLHLADFKDRLPELQRSAPQGLTAGCQLLNVPEYLQLQTDPARNLRQDRVFRTKGYCIQLGRADSVENYLKEHFKPNFRTSLRRRLKGLEDCFNVRYQMFCGDMERAEYDDLMEHLCQMIVRRFNQRNDRHMALKNWEAYRESAYELILQEKASLFVIYDDNIPIQIALSFHLGPILFLSIPSYNIDYARFGLGNIAVYKVLEWCYENGFSMLDMGFGAFDYKLKWCNSQYDFYHRYYFTGSSPGVRIRIAVAKAKTRLINVLLRYEVNVLYHRVKDFIAGSKQDDLLAYTETPVASTETKTKDGRRIDPWKDNAYSTLRKPAVDFLYTNREHKSNLEVYELETGKRYFLKGLKKASEIILEGE